MDLTNIKIVNGIICTDEERTICELIKYDVEKELEILIDDALEYYNHTEIIII